MPDTNPADPRLQRPPVLDGGGPEADALLQGLLWLTRHHRRERSAASLLSGVPVQGALQPEQALRVMREAGYQAQWLERPLAELSPLLMPVLALLRDGDACVITRRLFVGQAAHYEILLPAAGGARCQVAEAELAGEYLGSHPAPAWPTRGCWIRNATGSGARCAASCPTTARPCWRRW
jgi:hypothetical protein